MYNGDPIWMIWLGMKLSLMALQCTCFVWSWSLSVLFDTLITLIIHLTIWIFMEQEYPSLNLRIQSISKFLIFCHLNRQISIINCFVKLILNLPSICFHGYQTFDNFFILHINVPMLKGHTITWLNKVNMAWIRIKKKNSIMSN